MKPIVRNILAVIAGFLVGSIVNSTIVNIGPSIIPLPEGADVSSMEALKESMKLFQPQNFIPPFLAHALGTLVGVLVACVIATSHHFKIAIGLGIFFLLGGITAVFLFGGPIWFILLDLIVAYIPMAFLGWKLSGKE